jgi:two-component sensor histidine kinase
MDTKLPTGIADGRALAQSIVDTLREPLLILDRDLRVVVASRAYYVIFKVARQDVQGRHVYALGDGQWDSAELRTLLEQMVAGPDVIEAFEVERDFAGIGKRVMVLNARQMVGQSGPDALILLSIDDITARRGIEHQMAELMHQKDILLLEMQHRVANSLQIIASILLLKAQSVQSEETRLHLHDAHRRVMSVAAVQQQLLTSGSLDSIQLASYLSRLCETLAASMIGENRPVLLKVEAEDRAASSNEAVSLGLIVTELVINALKHAFVDDKPGSLIVVHYDVSEPNWRLKVSDNGIGRQAGDLRPTIPGLGTSIVEALARQLEAEVEISMQPEGTSVSVTHQTMPLPLIAVSASEEARAAQGAFPPSRMRGGREPITAHPASAASV